MRLICRTISNISCTQDIIFVCANYCLRQPRVWRQLAHTRYQTNFVFIDFWTMPLWHGVPKTPLVLDTILPQTKWRLIICTIVSGHCALSSEFGVLGAKGFESYPHWSIDSFFLIGVICRVWVGSMSKPGRWSLMRLIPWLPCCTWMLPILNWWPCPYHTFHRF